MNYLLAQQKAHAKILKAGRMADITWDVPASVDVLAVVPDGPVTGSGQIAMAAFPLARKQIAADTYAEQQQILRRSRRVLISAYRPPVEPKDGLRVLNWEGDNWTVDGLNPLCPDGATVVMYSGTMHR